MFLPTGLAAPSSPRARGGGPGLDGRPRPPAPARRWRRAADLGEMRIGVAQRSKIDVRWWIGRGEAGQAGEGGANGGLSAGEGLERPG